jgi:predicted 3-demethylubiquinone-9 3-methyltransferase (glyoxalase superfamily)
MPSKQKIKPCLWFDNNAEEAVNQYVSRQIIPTALTEMLSDKDPEKSKRVMEAMLKMNKIDIDKLKEAYQAPASAHASRG